MAKIRPYWRFMRWLVRVVSILYFRVRCHSVRNVPTEGGVLLVSNHQSFMDPMIGTMGLPRESCYMARDTLFKNRFFGWLIASVNSFPVKRGSADVGAIKESLRRLKKGYSLMVFPEGTRSEDGRVGPMLPGLTAIARKAKVPIVPMLVDGMLQSWPRNAALPRPGEVIIVYGSPMMPADYLDMSSEELTDELRRRIIAMQLDLHSRLPARRLEWYNAERERWMAQAESES